MRPGGLREKEERKQLAGKMNPRGSKRLCASPLSPLGCQVPCLRRAGEREFPAECSERQREVRPVHVEFQRW